MLPFSCDPIKLTAMKNFGIILLLMLVSNLNYAQEHLIQGVVHAFENVPLIGAEIKVKSTKQSVFTDTTGQFTVTCYAKDKLKIRAKGFYGHNVKVAPNTKYVAVNLKIKPGEQNLENAIGYGYISERDKTTAVSTMKTDYTTYSRYRDMHALLISEFAGVQVMNGQVIIRGVSSFTSSSAALVVIDGVISDSDALLTMSPLEVKSISVIKDGSSAIYGSRGSNGVVLVETKKGGD